jgi:hypothetical protein
MSVVIKIEGDGLLYSKDTTILKASQIIAFLNADNPESISTSEPSNISDKSLLQLSSSVNYNKSPREFLVDSNAKTNPQKILAFAKYHCEKNNVFDFEPATVRMYFKKSGESEPKNFTRDLKEAILLRYVYETDESGHYSITEHGEKVLSEGFVQESKLQSSKKRSSTTKTVSSRMLTEGVVDLEFSPHIESLVSFHDLVTKGDKILWILYFGYKNNQGELTSSDIEFIASKFLEKIPTGNLAALTESNYKRGYLTKTSTGKFKLLHKGVEYLENLNKESH